MKNKFFLVFFVVVLVALSLAACERSASTPPPDSGGNEGFPTLEATPDPIDVMGEYATQTAQAQAPDSGGEETPDEGDTTQPTEEPKPTEKPDDKPDATPVPPQEYPVPKNYTLQKGEFPFCIARRFDISPGALLAANGLTNSSVTYAGQTLKIPQDAGSFDAGPRSLKSHPDTYTVRAGDTVYSIACLYGSVDPRAIEAENGLSGAYTLKVGDTLKIP